MPRQLHHPDPQDVTLAQALSALGDPVRLRILAVLADRGEHPREDFDGLGVGSSTVSHHMRTLREAGLTRHRLEGTRCFVSLRRDALRACPEVLDGVLRAAAEAR
ncbi:MULTISPECIES: ArsR/SmtB family transcription factor [unclassified Streptomyces]|uniref:ArsR/SmtB family transcription factor n=1 Tax=unclassified Streptomyces TaxID=2593676 RepID=UPI002E1BD01B|nr:metalloregulator ArsR/SmtB family transcription factor [Streptomyces sp. NBC_01023]